MTQRDGEGGIDAADTSAEDAERDADTDAAATNYALVTVAQFPKPLEYGTRYRILAQFSSGSRFLGRDCTTERANECSVVACKNGNPRDLVSAGTLTVDAPQQTVELPWPARGPYRKAGESPLWSEPATVTFQASGDTVPAFEMSFPTVTDIRVTSPELPAPSDPLRIDTASPLTIEWEPTSDDSRTFQVTLNSENDSRFSFLNCYWNAASGEGTIPQVLLGSMVQSDGGFSFSAGTTKTKAVGQWNVRVSVEEIADDGSDQTGMANGPAVFE